MPLYAGFSLTIDSQFELPLEPGIGSPDVKIHRGIVDGRSSPATIADEVAFPQQTGRFHIRGGREIVVDPLPGADAGVLTTLLLGRMMAYLLRQRGYLPLHASGVEIAGRGVLFLGETGAGKSTAAAALHTRGHRVLADDVSAVRISGAGVEVQAAWPGLRLHGDAVHATNRSATPTAFEDEKHVFRVVQPQVTHSVTVKRIYFLRYNARGERSAVRIEALPKTAAAALFNSNSFLRPWRAGPELRQINLDRSSLVATVAASRRLVRPRSLESLAAFADFVEKDAMTND
jgi:hypothetical protein